MYVVAGAKLPELDALVMVARIFLRPMNRGFSVDFVWVIEYHTSYLE